MYFSGYRKFNSRIYWNELELVFEQARIVASSALEDGAVVFKIVTENLEGRSTISVEKFSYPYEVAFSRIMQNFADAINVRADNYLSHEDLIVNTSSCNSLVAKGEFKN